MAEPRIIVRLTPQGKASNAAPRKIVVHQAAVASASDVLDEDALQVWMGNVPSGLTSWAAKLEIQAGGLPLPTNVLLRDNERGRYAVAHFSSLGQVDQVLAKTSFRWNNGKESSARPLRDINP